MERAYLSLHPAQLDVFTDQLINPESPHYNIGGYIRLKGRLNKEKFKETIQSIPEVFDAFKLKFHLHSDEPLCYVDERYNGHDLTELDLSDFDNPMEEAKRLMQKRFNIPFELKESSGLFENYLIKIGEEEYWFYGKYHHLLTDGYGFVVLVKYIAQKYQSLVKNDGLQFSYPSYTEVVARAAEYFSSPDYTLDENYWKNKIVEKSNKVLAVKYPALDDTGYSSSRYVLEISPERRKLLDELQLATKAGLQQLTIAALSIYFGKTSDYTEFIFGTTVHKRATKKLKNVVGMFSGILPFKSSYQQDQKLAELIKEISTAQREDYRHQHYPIGTIARNLKIQTAEGYLHQISVNYEPLDFELNFGDGLSADVERLANDHDRNPLQISWRAYGEHQPLQLYVYYRNEYFNQKEIALFIDRLLFIIEQFPANLNNALAGISILPANERGIIEHFNDTKASFPNDKSLVDLIEEQVSKSPDAIAVVFEAHQLTYKELNHRANQLAYYLRRKGVREETLVPICLDRSVAMIIGILGILKSGGAYVPIDPEYPEERISYMLENIVAKIVVTTKESRLKLSVFGGVEMVVLDGEESIAISRESTANLSITIKPNQLAYMMYTSGSTGKPKGAMNEHRGVVNRLCWAKDYYQVTPEDAVLQKTTFCFDVSVWELLLPLLAGSKLVFANPEGHKDNAYLKDIIKQQKITVIHFVPSMLEVFLPALHKGDCPGLKKVLCSGEALKPSQALLFREKLPGSELHNLYGPTEAAIDVTFWKMPETTGDINLVPIGRPVANTSIYILNKENDIAPIGCSGEIYIGGVQVGRGYLGLPELTTEKFVPDPFSDEAGARMYKTGDLGRWLTDGNIEYLGRIDEQVKIRGFRVELGEIESLLQEMDMVKQAVVLARNDKEGNKRLVGYIVPEGSFDKDTVQSFLRKKLPGYMVPALWVSLESIPLTSNGKVNRKALPDPDASELLSNEYLAPANEIEFTLAAAWKDMLKVDRVGVNDNFFELGGHSLNAIRLTSRLHKLLNIKIDISAIFSNPTIRQLGKAIEREKQQLFVEIKRLPQQEFYDLSHAQNRFWILSHFRNGSEAYNVSKAFIIEGDFDISAFKHAFDVVIERHEILRTVFVNTTREAKQKILAPTASGFVIETIDLQQQTNPQVIIKQWLEEDAKRPFDLSKGPLLRTTIFQEATGRFVLVFNIHHIISDGWSKGILIQELLQAYKAICMGTPLALPPLPIQYKDYAAWHLSAFEQQGQYWRDLFKNGVPVLKFPVDFERPKVLTFFGAMLHNPISEPLTNDLRKKAIGCNMSLNNLLFALYGLVVARLSGQEELVIGSLSSGRSHIDLENLVGVFINFLPVKLAPLRSLELSAYLENSNQALVQAYNNQDYPFDRMVEECIPDRDISRNPFFDTMVNFHLENDLAGSNGTENEQLAGTGISIKPYHEIQDDLFQSVLDFKLDIEPAANALDFYLSYNSKLFLPETMQSFMDQFVELLTNVVNEPGKTLQEYGDWAEENNTLAENKMDDPDETIPEMPLHICASFVMEPVQEFIEYWSNEFELNVKLSFAPYNQVFQQLINPQSGLNTATGINVLVIRVEDWIRNISGQPESGQLAFLHKTVEDFIKLLKNAGSNTAVPFFIGIVPASENTVLSPVIISTINSLNSQLIQLIAEQPRFDLLELAKIARLYDVEELFDAKSDELGHMPFSQEFYAALGTYLARKVNAFKGPGYKVIALDCDNTLWKGVCGELGAMEVTIDENFSRLQEFVLEKYKEGFLLVLCSKNNEADVWEVFDRHPGMKLKREHIAAHRINWQPKSGNLVSIARELNLGLASFIFLDDSEFEIEQMSVGCPEVYAIPLPDSAEDYGNFMDHIWAFDTFRITAEDAKRNQLYQLEKQRKDEQEKFGSLEDFLVTLDIKVNINPLTANELERAVQLTLRTNQFNLNGIRKIPAEIAALIQEENAINWVIDVKDRFGDYGIVGIVLAGKENNALVINSFLLSCRVLGRNVEDHILNELEKYGEGQGLQRITALFKATEKNKPFQDFLTRTNWLTDSKNNSYYRLLTKKTAPNKHEAQTV